MSSPPTMSPTQFKLTQTGPGALTRRVTFAEQPTWFVLASRLEALYGIPIQDVGVTYLDSDGDEITISTHEEMQDYYAFVPTGPNETIKFTVKNIGSLRAQQRRQHPSPGPNIFDMGPEDFIPIPPMFSSSPIPPPPPPKSPSAFVETVDSSVTEEPVQVEHSDEESENADDASSVVSVLHDDVPHKKPVHVYEFDTEGGYVRDISPPVSARSLSLSSASSRSEPPVISMPRSRSISPDTPAQSLLFPRPYSGSPGKSSAVGGDDIFKPTINMRAGRRSRSRSRSPPRVWRPISRSPSRSPPTPIMVERRSRSQTPIVVIPRTRSVSPRSPVPMDPPSPVLGAVPDPPLPTTDARSPQASFATTTQPSLTNDVAELLNSLTYAFGSHPELSEGLKNIVRNASQGAYWAAERDVMVNDALRAAECAQDGIARAAELAQEEAGRKVADALGGVFRALGSIVGTATSSPATIVVSQPQLRPDERIPERIPSPRTEESPERPQSRSRGGSRARSPSLDPLPRSRSPSPPLHRSRSHSPPGRERPPSPRDAPRMRPELPQWYRGPRTFYHPYGPPPQAGASSSPQGHPWGPPPPGPPPGPPPPSHHHPTPYPPFPLPFMNPVGQGSSRQDSYAGPFPQVPMWFPPGHHTHGLRRSNTLPGRFGGAPISRFGPEAQTGPPPVPPPPPSFNPNVSSAERKARLEAAKEQYKAQKEEWRKAKEARRREKEMREMQRMERQRQKERRTESIRRTAMHSDGEPTPPPVPSVFSQFSSTRYADINLASPRPAELVNSRAAEFERLSNDNTLRQILMRRLSVMGFTPQTHPNLEMLVFAHTRKRSGSGEVTNTEEETLIANILDDLLAVPVPEASGSNIRQGTRGNLASSGVAIPGAWRNM
ncbi:hypothetical protein K439DRAFT_451013 [Ramaria rubella]|nr:hypothetical protein K439DRAFT_451013 [Ramaria rubella]